jgi:hypothetical protein
VEGIQRVGRYQVRSRAQLAVDERGDAVPVGGLDGVGPVDGTFEPAVEPRAGLGQPVGRDAVDEELQRGGRPAGVRRGDLGGPDTRPS